MNSLNFFLGGSAAPDPLFPVGLEGPVLISFIRKSPRAEASGGAGPHDEESFKVLSKLCQA